SGAGDPGHERGVFHRVPGPVAAPTEDGVGPVGAEKDADGLEGPGHHGPAASDVDPFLAGITAKERGESEGERDRESGVAEVEVRRMNGHFRILEQRVEPVAVGAGENLRETRGADGAEKGEGAGDEAIQ